MDEARIDVQPVQFDHLGRLAPEARGEVGGTDGFDPFAADHDHAVVDRVAVDRVDGRAGQNGQRRVLGEPGCGNGQQQPED